MKKRSYFKHLPLFLSTILILMASACSQKSQECPISSEDFPSFALAAHLIPEYTDEDGTKRKWCILEDVQPSTFKISDFELVPFLGGDERWVRGDVMRTRAIQLKANLGLSDAKYLLDHESEIPIEFRDKFLVFTGTLLQRPDGVLLVARLYWSDDHWGMNFRWVIGDWDDKRRLLRIKSST